MINHRTQLVAMIAIALSVFINSSKAEQPSRGELYYYQPPALEKPETIKCDIAIYGGTPAGVTAAVQAAKLGRKVILVSHNQHVGGMTSGGLTATDVGKKSSIGGLA